MIEIFPKLNDITLTSYYVCFNGYLRIHANVISFLGASSKRQERKSFVRNQGKRVEVRKIVRISYIPGHLRFKWFTKIFLKVVEEILGSL